MEEEPLPVNRQLKRTQLTVYLLILLKEFILKTKILLRETQRSRRRNTRRRIQVKEDKISKRVLSNFL